MEIIKIKDEMIRLGQFLKLACVVSTGGEAKVLIQSGQVKVNGNVLLPVDCRAILNFKNPSNVFSNALRPKPSEILSLIPYSKPNRIVD